MKYQTLTIVIFSLFLSSSTLAKSDNINDIYFVIKRLSPHVQNKNAYNYAIIIDKYSRQYKIDWKIVVAIAKKESDFIHGEISNGYRDFGITQFHWKTIKNRKLNLAKVLSDADYAFNETFRMLAELKKAYYTGAKGHYQWFTRYHSFTPKRRREYWNGRKVSGHDGLRHKFFLINKVLNERLSYSSKSSTSSGSFIPKRRGI